MSTTHSTYSDLTTAEFFGVVDTLRTMTRTGDFASVKFQRNLDRYDIVVGGVRVGCVYQNNGEWVARVAHRNGYTDSRVVALGRNRKEAAQEAICWVSGYGVPDTASVSLFQVGG